MVQEALARQEQERSESFAVPNDALDELRQLPPHRLLDLIRDLRHGRSRERELAARLLSTGQLTSAQILDEVREAVEAEGEGDVLRWLVIALRDARDARAMGQLVEFANHADAQVRFPVPDAVSACAATFAEAAPVLYQLSKDPDRDVRWSAVYELVAWISAPSDGVTRDQQDEGRRWLQQLATSESDEEIRALARTAM